MECLASPCLPLSQKCLLMPTKLQDGLWQNVGTCGERGGVHIHATCQYFSTSLCRQRALRPSRNDAVQFGTFRENILHPYSVSKIGFSSKTCVTIYQTKRCQMTQWLCPNVTNLAFKFRHRSTGLESSQTGALRCWSPLCSETRRRFSLYHPSVLKQVQVRHTTETAYFHTISIWLDTADMNLSLNTSYTWDIFT
jgi:hypothetical protein